jgi:hypothetical protein
MHEGVTLHTRGIVLVAWQVSGAGTLDWWDRVLKHALIFWNESFTLHGKSAPKKKKKKKGKKKEIIIIIHNLDLNIHSILQLSMQMPVTSRPLPFLRIDKSRPVSGCLWGQGKGRKSASHDPPDMLAADYGDQHRK